MNKFLTVLSIVASAQASYVAPGYAGLPLALGSGLTYTSYAPQYATTQYAAPHYVAPQYIAAAAAPHHHGYAGPIAAATPVVHAAHIPAQSSQFQSGDELGNFNYGYSNVNSAKQESGNAYGGVQGSYSYVDANGQLQVTNYVADDLGFRVAATNLPVGPDSNPLEAPVDTGVAPSPVEDTPEVKAAKAEFNAAFEEAKLRHKRDAGVLPASTQPLVHAAPLTYAVASPYAYAAAGPYATNYAIPHGAGPYATNYAIPHGTGYAVPHAIKAYSYATHTSHATPYATTYAAPTAAYTTAYSGAPLAVASPAVREAVLTKVQLNPGHATAYRVY